MIINLGFPRLIVLLNAVFSVDFRCLQSCFLTLLDYRFYWQVHNPQNALAWHLLSGAWESSQRCGQALYTTLELHQGEKFTTPVLGPWPPQFKLHLCLTGFWSPVVNISNITLSSEIWWSIIRFCDSKDFLLLLDNEAEVQITLLPISTAQISQHRQWSEVQSARVYPDQSPGEKASFAEHITIRAWYQEHHVFDFQGTHICLLIKKKGYLEWTLSNLNAINAHKCKWSLRFWGRQQTGRRESSTMRSPFIMPTFRSLLRASTSSTLRYTISSFHAVCEHSLICFKCVDNHCCTIYVIKHCWHLIASYYWWMAYISGYQSISREVPRMILWKNHVLDIHQVKTNK